MPPTSLTILAGVLVTLAFFVLIGYIVRTMVRTEFSTLRLAATLSAITFLLIGLTSILYALHGPA
jgi:uncharacterized membrane protein